MMAGDQTPAERRTILDCAARLGAEGHTAVLAGGPGRVGRPRRHPR